MCINNLKDSTDLSSEVKIREENESKIKRKKKFHIDTQLKKGNISDFMLQKGISFHTDDIKNTAI